VLGGAGKDIIDGGPPPPTPTSFAPRERSFNNSDVLLGEEGPDLIEANIGADRALGEDGAAVLLDGEGHRGSIDVLLGGDGNDILLPRNKPAGQDLGDCGGGRDTAYADRTDLLIDCERVLIRDLTKQESNDIFGKFIGTAQQLP